MSKTVYPVPDRFLAGVPAVEHECSDAFCVESGAFTTKKPPPTKAELKNIEAPETPGPSDSTKE